MCTIKIKLLDDEKCVDALFGNFKVLKHFVKGAGRMGLFFRESKKEGRELWASCYYRSQYESIGLCYFYSNFIVRISFLSDH